MRARHAYRLLVRRGGLLPASLADPARVDHVELVEVASGETALCFDLSPLAAKRLLKALRHDLAELEVEQFHDRWLGVEEEGEAAENHNWEEGFS